MSTHRNPRWEIFFDRAFYDMWAVRPIGDKTFSSPMLFHFGKKEDAEQFKALAEKAHCAVMA